MVALITKRYYCNEIKMNEMEWACGTQGKKNACRVSVGKSEGKSHLRACVDRKITLTYVLYRVEDCGMKLSG